MRFSHGPFCMLVGLASGWRTTILRGTIAQYQVVDAGAETMHFPHAAVGSNIIGLNRYGFRRRSISYSCTVQ